MQGFDVHYQPIVDVQSLRWIGIEALCRWQTPSGDRVSPAEFIHMAEQLGFIGQLDFWVLETAMRHCISLGLDKKDFTLNVNLSPKQKIDDTLIDRLLVVLRKTGFPAEKLNLEITESADAVFDNEKLHGLHRVAQSGIALSLDDFGTGYSSFAALTKISAGAFKVDRVFVESIEYDDYRQRLLKMLVDIAHYRNMRIVVEGVETKEQFELLKQRGVDRVQGFLFSKPLSYEQLMKMLYRFDRIV
jgi:EAL domain-containing protein (putative c-di-GMP-specific phosphodiesterase class I)